MPLPTRSDVHISEPLTNMAIAWFQDNPGIASQVFPLLPVTKSIDAYHVWDLDDLLRRVAKVRAPGTPSVGAGFRISNTSYRTHKYSLHTDIPWDTLDEADAALNLEGNLALALMKNVTMEFEAVWAAANFATGIWATDQVGAVDFTKWDAGGSTPIVDMRGAIRLVQKRTGFKPNTITFGADVWDVIVDHASFVDRVKATGSDAPAVITRELVAGILEVDRVLVAEMVESTSVEGAATPTTDFIVDSEAVLITYAAASPSTMLPSAGYTFARTGRTVPNGSGVSVNRFDIDANEATRVEAQGEWDTKVTAPELGLFMSDAIT